MSTKSQHWTNKALTYLTISFENLQKNIKCSEIQDQTLELELDGKLYQILIDDLYYTSIINPALVCQRYLHALKNVANK